MSRLPPLNAIRAFEVAARHGSFVRAASELGVTHWAVGKQIRLLEDWLGVPLFERRAQGVALTHEGSDLLGDVGDVFSRLARAAERLRRPDMAGRVAGAVRVNMLSSFALRWLLPRLGTFQALYPKVEVRISTTSRKLRYIANAFDVGIRSGPEQGEGLECEPLMADIRRPACSPEILRQRPLESVLDLRRHTLLHSATTRSAWSRWLSAAGVPDLTAFRHFEVEHVYLQLQAAVDGLGVALASTPLIEGDIAAGRLVCPIPAPAWRAEDYTLIVRKDRADSAPVRAFRDWITATARGSSTSG